ncbi:MAG: FimV/HubP family polar landmark protein [Shewanella sp.]
MTKIAKLFGLLALTLSAHSAAQVSHVSLNGQMFALGAHPKLRLNVITHDQDLTRLAFWVRQSRGEEKLMAEPVNRFLVLLTGVEDVTDPQAQLVVKEYRIDRWHEVKQLPLFVMPMALGANTAALTPGSRPVTAVAKETSLASAQLTADSVKTQTTQSMPPAVALTKNNLMGGCTLVHSANETLWRIASRYANEWNVSVYAAMLAIYDANPAAFANNKINGLKPNVSLLCPYKDVLSHYPSAQEAKAIFDAKMAE